MPITVLHYTSAAQPLILQSILPFSSETYCGLDALKRGKNECATSSAAHNCVVFFPSYWPSKSWHSAVVTTSRHDSKTRKNIFPIPEVIESPVITSNVRVPTAAEQSSVHPTCAVMRLHCLLKSEFVNGQKTDPSLAACSPLATNSDKPKPVYILL